MICWVMYDIKNDRIRSKVSKICEQMGLSRVQYSVFLGTLDKNEKDILELQLKDLIDAASDSVYIIPVNREELYTTVLLGQAFDKKYITNEVKSLFL